MQALGEDFETGGTSLTLTTGGDFPATVEFSPINPITGVYSAVSRAVFAPSTMLVRSWVWMSRTLPTQINELWLEGKLRIDSVGIYGVSTFGVSQAHAFGFSIGIHNSNHQWYIYRNPGSKELTGLTAALGQPYHIKVHLKRASASGVPDGVCQVWFNDGFNDILVSEDYALDNYAAGPYASVRCGMTAEWNVPSVEQMVQVTEDDFYVYDSDPWGPPPTTYNLAVDSSISGVPFTLRGATVMSYVTPFSSLLDERVYEIEMPSNVIVGADTYNFVQWENGSTSPTRAVNLLSDLNLFSTNQLQLVTAIEVHAFYDGVEVTADGLIVETGFTFQTPATIEVTPGTYTVRLTYGEVTRDYSVAVSEEQTIRLDGQLTPPTPPSIPLKSLLAPFSAVGVGLILIARRKG